MCCKLRLSLGQWEHNPHLGWRTWVTSDPAHLLCPLPHQLVLLQKLHPLLLLLGTQSPCLLPGEFKALLINSTTGTTINTSVHWGQTWALCLATGDQWPSPPTLPSHWVPRALCSSPPGLCSVPASAPLPGLSLRPGGLSSWHFTWPAPHRTHVKRYCLWDISLQI